ncbi:MAG: hypothetical protein OXN19_16025 [Caldilineaceae bacterium]|nr:hypothetical protein [Caldilineaceae bacterium]
MDCFYVGQGNHIPPASSLCLVRGCDDAEFALMGAYWIFGGVLDMSMRILGRTERARVWTIVGAIMSSFAVRGADQTK